MNIQNTIETKVKEGFLALYNTEIPSVEFQATRKEFEGDITVVVFPMLRYKKGNPAVIGEELGKYVVENVAEITNYNVVKGFLNLVIDDAFYTNFFNAIYADVNYGFVSPKEDEKAVMVEYSSPNTNKPLHLGHIRNNLLGYSVAEILKASGKKVYKTQIINDRGIHICKSMLAWKKYGNGETPASTGLKGDKLVGNYYVKFDQEYKKEISELVATGKTEEEAKKELLPRMASAEDVWCQLFSEPSAGSDVAGLRTRAERDGDNWKLNGQKIWTSGAQYSDFGVVLTRTDPDVSKYRGLTMFMINMRQEGVDVKPIKQMNGGQHFNEVFVNNAIVPDRYRLGEVGGGWTGALTVLMSERLAISGIQPTGFPQFLDLVKSLEINGEPIAHDPIVRDRLAGWYSQYAGLQSANKRMITAVARGGIAGAEASLGKLVGAQMNQEIANFACQLFGQAGIIQDSGLSPENSHFQDSVLFSPGVRLAGGTDEVMRNILAEQVLGLPQEPRADKGMPLKDIPTGSS